MSRVKSDGVHGEVLNTRRRQRESKVWREESWKRLCWSIFLICKVGGFKGVLKIDGVTEGPRRLENEVLFGAWRRKESNWKRYELARDEALHV